MGGPGSGPQKGGRGMGYRKTKITTKKLRKSGTIQRAKTTIARKIRQNKNIY